MSAQGDHDWELRFETQGRRVYLCRTCRAVWVSGDTDSYAAVGQPFKSAPPPCALLEPASPIDFQVDKLRVELWKEMGRRPELIPAALAEAGDDPEITRVETILRMLKVLGVDPGAFFVRVLADETTEDDPQA